MDLLAPLADIAAVVVPVFLIAALGYGWRRAGLRYDSAFITTFAVNVSTPCLVFSSLVRLTLRGDELLTMALASVGCIALAGVAGAAILLACRLPLRVYLPALSFPNGGNLGIPVCMFAFGEAGLGLAVLFFAVLAVLQFTLGPAIAAGRVDLRQILRTPVIHAVLLALLVSAAGIRLPLWLGNTTTLLGNCAVPLMLFSLGVALSGLRMQGMGRSLAMSALRLGLGLAAGLVMVEALQLEGVVRGVVLLESSMPVAVFNYLWALRYGNAPEEVAGTVLGSTALACLGLPVLLLAVM